MESGHRKPDHLPLIIDRNRLQQGAGTKETSGLDPLDQKYVAFGWDVTMIGGHDPSALLAEVSAAPNGKPRCSIAAAAHRALARVGAWTVGP